MARPRPEHTHRAFHAEQVDLNEYAPSAALLEEPSDGDEAGKRGQRREDAGTKGRTRRRNRLNSTDRSCASGREGTASSFLRCVHAISNRMRASSARSPIASKASRLRQPRAISRPASSRTTPRERSPFAWWRPTHSSCSAHRLRVLSSDPAGRALRRYRSPSLGARRGAGACRRALAIVGTCL